VRTFLLVARKEHGVNVSMETFPLPTLWCPFPSRMHPLAAQVQQETMAWLRHWGLTNAHGVRSVPEVGRLAARLHPHASRPLLQLTSDWYAWMFSQEDHHDESAARADPRMLQAKHARFLDILRGDDLRSDDEPTVRALGDLQQRLCHLASQEWMHMFIYKVGEYFNATLWEALNRAHNVVPSVPTYTMLRPITAGLELEHVLVHVIDQAAMPSAPEHAALARHATQQADQAVCWGNDLVSFPKEVRHGDVHNLVLVLQHERACSLPQAIEQALALHDAAVAECAAALAALAPAAETDAYLRRYLDVVQNRVSGHIAWVVESVRYQQRLALAQQS
jgi:5-epi-alpha-selinene synthase